MLGRLVAGGSLEVDEAQTVLSHILEGEATEAQVAAFAVLLRAKG
ncbi:MAG: anthranilate phosphoribosyltransferase, partial [Candidatus Dormibacteria bacterium]